MHFPPRLDQRFWRLWTASATSSVGDGMVMIAFPLLALTYTHSAVLIAGIALAGTLPSFLVALPAGLLVDRVNRRRLMIGLDISRLAIIASFGALLLAGAASLVLLYATVFVLQCLRVVFDIGAAAALPSVVPQKLFFRANSNLYMSEIVGREIAGQALGGIAFAASLSLPFLADAASFAASAGLVGRAVPDNTPAPAGVSWTKDLADGLRWFLRLPLNRLLAGLVATFVFCQSVVMGVVVLYAISDLHMSRSGYGLALGLSSIGTAIVAAAAGQVHERLGTGWTLVTAGLAPPLAYAVLVITHSPVSMAASLALEASGVVLVSSAVRSIRQSLVPDELQGRVASVYQMVFYAAAPLGSLAGGALAEEIGLRHTFFLASAVHLTVLLIAAPKLLGAIRRHTHRIDLPKQALAA